MTLTKTGNGNYEFEVNGQKHTVYKTGFQRIANRKDRMTSIRLWALDSEFNTFNTRKEAIAAALK